MNIALFKFYLRCLALFMLLSISVRALFLCFAADINISYSALIYSQLWGLRFDVAVAAAYALLVVLAALILAPYKSALPLKFIIALLILVALGGGAGDIIYFQQSGRRLGYEAADFGNDAAALMLQALSSAPWVVAASLLIFLLFAYIVFTQKLKFKKIYRRSNILGTLCSFLLAIICSVFLYRGGSTPVPQDPSFAYKIGDNKLALYAANGIYNSLYYTFKSDKLELKLPATVIANADANYKLPAPISVQQTAVDTPKYIFILFMESWASKWLQQGATPNFVNFGKTGIYTPYMIAGGTRTTEGLFAALCSYPNPLGKSVANSQLANFKMRCLPEILREHGYTTSFFQGSNKETSGTGAFAQRLGFSNSYGKVDINAKYSTAQQNSWGFYDTSIYDFVLDKIAANPNAKMLIGINTNSTHDVHLPAGVSKFAKTATIEHIDVMHLADQEFSVFIDKLRAQGILQQSLILAFADHTAGKGLEGDLQRFSIPFFAVGKGIKPQLLNRAIHERDVAPTILDYLGIAPSAHMLGASLLRPASDRPIEYFSVGNIGWFTQNILTQININTAQSSCYLWRNKAMMPQAIDCKQTPNQQNITAKALAFIKLSQQRLFANKLLAATQ